MIVIPNPVNAGAVSSAPEEGWDIAFCKPQGPSGLLARSRMRGVAYGPQDDGWKK
jgi:hypothetical protein